MVDAASECVLTSLLANRWLSFLDCEQSMQFVQSTELGQCLIASISEQINATGIYELDRLSKIVPLVYLYEK